jgi:hypothetical protein
MSRALRRLLFVGLLSIAAGTQAFAVVVPGHTDYQDPNFLLADAPTSRLAISAFYQSYLYRSPAAAEVEGWYQWALNQHQNLARVENEIRLSRESCFIFVRSAYSLHLNRLPEPGASEAWCDFLQTNHLGYDRISEFVKTSEEYRLLHP